MDTTENMDTKAWGQMNILTNKRVETGDRSTYKRKKGWGKKHKQTHKIVGTEKDKNKQKGGNRKNKYEELIHAKLQIGKSAKL